MLLLKGERFGGLWPDGRWRIKQPSLWQVYTSQPMNVNIGLKDPRLIDEFPSKVMRFPRNGTNLIKWILLLWIQRWRSTTNEEGKHRLVIKPAASEQVSKHHGYIRIPPIINHHIASLTLFRHFHHHEISVIINWINAKHGDLTTKYLWLTIINQH